jgi:hypothetical protein
LITIAAPACFSRVTGKVAIATTVDPSVVLVNIYIDGNYYASSPPLIWDSATVANGSHVISVRAYRKHGVAVGSDSAPITVAN